MTDRAGPEEDRWQLQRRIAFGHAWDEHRFEFPEVVDRDAFVDVIDRIITTGQRKALSRHRTAFWSEIEQAVVITNSDDPDGGTVFRPDRGRAYFDELLAQST